MISIRRPATDNLYDGMNVIEEVDAGGNQVARYTHNLGVDDPLSEARAGTISLYQADALGSITSLSSSMGTLSNTYTYDSFGHLTASSGTVINPFQYTGRDFDAETGLYYYRARYYDSSIGRFINEDPIKFAGSSDFYAYTQNRPINAKDPTGLKIMLCSRGGFHVQNGLLGNHGFFYDTRNGDSCGKGSGNHPHGKDNPSTPGAFCVEVPGSDGHEDDVMSCCRAASDSSFAARHHIFPPHYDCQTLTRDCLKEAGLSNPGVPGGRWGCRGNCKPPLDLSQPIVVPRHQQ